MASENHLRSTGIPGDTKRGMREKSGGPVLRRKEGSTAFRIRVAGPAYQRGRAKLWRRNSSGIPDLRGDGGAAEVLVVPPEYRTSGGIDDFLT